MVRVMGVTVLAFWSLGVGIISPLPIQQSSLVGCYRVRLGRWSRSPETSERPPATFRLDSAHVPMGGGAEARRVEPDIFPHYRGPWPIWTVRASSDTIDVVWSTGFVGVVLGLAPKGDTLRGIAHMFTDVKDALVPDPQASALAVRIDCRGLGAS